LYSVALPTAVETAVPLSALNATNEEQQQVRLYAAVVPVGAFDPHPHLPQGSTSNYVVWVI
jgi:hypothetical protein